jgi:predicted ATPase
MSLTELVGRIDDRFEVLIGGPRSAPQRHQTLRDTVGWSFRLLDADEERVIRSLSAFRGGCDTESAEAVCTPLSSGDVLDVLIRLVNKSLAIPVDVDGTTRYCLHETIRSTAHRCLQPIGMIFTRSTLVGSRCSPSAA